MTLLSVGTVAQAQSGNGAYVQRNTGPQCIGNILLGVAALNISDCVTMTQTVFMVLPNGSARSVWVATLPPNLAPAIKTVFKSSWTESFNGVTYYYDNTTVAMPDGSLKLTLNGDDGL